METPEEHRQYLMDMLRVYRHSQILITCAELGVFSSLGRETLEVEKLAALLGTDPPALARLLNAAVALGLLEKEGTAYRVSPSTIECLVESRSPLYMGNLVKREGAFYRRWSRLTEAVRTGERPPENTADEQGVHWVRNFELALYDAARTTAPLVAKALEPFLPQKATPRRVIDVGGGHGAYSIALAEHFAGLEAVVFELPAAAGVARDIIAASPVADRVTTQAGDFRVDDLGQGYDAALLFGVLVSETAASAKALLSKVYEALLPGGWVVIRGNYLNPDRISPLDATLSDLHMLLSTASGTVQTFEQLEGWLKDSGFNPPQKLELPPPERTSLTLAQKPLGSSQ